MLIRKRITSPTPKFFRVLRNLGLVLAATGGTIIAAPIVLPALITTLGGYLVVAGGFVSAVSQLTVKDEILGKTQDDHEH